LQENVLSFVPKLVAFVLMLLVAGPWALERLERFTESTADTIARVGRQSGR
jgi:flagellar biosynthesis protein FliQ